MLTLQKKCVSNWKNTSGFQGRTTMTFKNDYSPTRRRIIKGAGAVAVGIAAPSIIGLRSAYAAYPDRPIKVVVANTPGGPSDLVGRIVTAALQQSTGKTFIIENIGGAGGNIGMGHVARSEPDGYCLLYTSDAADE